LKLGLKSFVIQSILVKGVVADDHGNNFSSATQITVDNAGYWGRIDKKGDVDFFKINIPDPLVSEIVFRITDLSPEMLPELKVYDSNEKLLQQKIYEVGNRYILSISIKPDGNNIFYASVNYARDDGTGTYSISAGPRKSSDTP